MGRYQGRKPTADVGALTAPTPAESVI